MSGGLYFGLRLLFLTREYLTYSKEIFEDSLIKNLFVDLRTGIYIERKQGGMLKASTTFRFRGAQVRD